MRCAACAADNRSGVRFCEECGARLEAACPACGAAVPGDKKFCGACGASLATGAAPTAPRFASPQAYTPDHLAARILKDRATLAGERKQVTVLFADVSGFTSMSERLDPEDVHALINRAFELMLAEVHRYEGTVNQFLGDGLMALFGAPVAHEDHALRAAHAALAMQAALTRYRAELAAARSVDFTVRMGLNTGLVVVGAIGDNLRMDYTAVGDTTNTASRMLGLAAPGRIVVAAATRRLIAAFFDLAPLGARSLKGKREAVAAWELGPAKPTVSRLAARVERGLSPFLGRDDAIAQLDRAWAAARAGRGQAVFVVGDPGIGKSRLLLEFRRRVGGAATWVQADCISFGHAVPFLPIVQMLKQNFRIDDHDDAATIVEKVERGLRPLGEDGAAAAPYLRYLLAVDPGDPAVATMDPARRRAQVVDAIRRLTATGSRRRPIVLAVEDTHWIDSASEDLLKALAESLPGMAALLIVTYRPVYQQPFGDRTYYWRLALQPIESDDAVTIVRSTLGVNDLPRALATTIAAKAEGNPFFLEEIGRSLVETGTVRVEGGQLVLARSAAAIAVPETVQDVIAARLDRLAEPQKRTVQTASVIGREFALSLLRRVSDLQDQLEQSLGELKRIELIYERGGLGELEYVFRHALTQDVAYASLLQSERRRLHGGIGRAIEDVYAGRLDEHTEELAYHFARGELWDKVVHYAREAAERAAALCVDDRAVEFYEQALAALQRLPETAETARLGVEVRLAMRAPLWRGGHPDRLFALFKEAEALASRHGFGEHLDTVYAFLVQYYWAKGEQDQALEYGQRCLERADAREDLGLWVTGHFYLSHACHALGRFVDGLRHARAIVERLEGPGAVERFGHSGLPYSGACAQGAECLIELGDESGALELLRRGQRVADAANHRYSQTVLEIVHGAVLVARGATAEAIALLESTARTCREMRFVGQLINAAHQLAFAYLAAGRPRDAIGAAREAIDLQERAKVSISRSSQLTVLGRAHLAVGELEPAQAALDAARDFAERCGERGWRGWLAVAEAELAARRGERAAAERFLDEAQEIAEELGMRPLLERARLALRQLG